jgi:hypothetical protein
MPEGRLGDVERLMDLARSTPMGPMAVCAILAAARRGPAGVPALLSARPERAAMVAGLLATAFFGAWTGSMKTGANFPLLGAIALEVLLFSAPLPARSGAAGDASPSREDPLAARAAVAIVLVGFLVYAGREMAGHGVWSWKASNLDAGHALAAPGLAGWRCNRSIGEGVDRAVEYIRAHVSPGESLFVFPDATVIYGLSGRAGYVPAPFLFHLGVFPPEGRLRTGFTDAFKASPPRWFLKHHQREKDFYEPESLLAWLELDRFVAARYRPAWRSGEFEMLRLLDSKP